MESQPSVEGQPPSTPTTQDSSTPVATESLDASIPETSAVPISLAGFPIASTAVSQQVIMQQLAAAQSTQGMDPAQSHALAQLAQAGLLQAQGGLTFIQGPGGVPLNFVQSEQQQQQIVTTQGGQQFAAVPQSPAQQNSLGESPAPHTPGSNSLGSPPPQIVDGNTSRSGTPAAPTTQQVQAASLELQLQMQAAQIQNAQKMQAMQQAQAQQQAQQQSQQAALIAQAQAQAQKEEMQKTLKPPKKPLTPYMRFSKSVWPRVKEQNMGMSVCEIGASIGKMWRELSDEEKTRYNDDFTADKVRYDQDLQKYLKLTGLQASDLVKPRSRKKKAAQHAVTAPSLQQQQAQAAEAAKQTAAAQAAAAAAQQQQQQQQMAQQLLLSQAAAQQISPNQAMLLQGQLAATQIQGQGQTAQLPAQVVNGPSVSYQQSVNGGMVLADPNHLPGFTQVWSEGGDAAQTAEGQQQQQVASLNAYISMIQQAQLHAQQQLQAQQAGGGEAVTSQVAATQEQQQQAGVASSSPQAVEGANAQQAQQWSQWHQPNTTSSANQDARSEPRTPVSAEQHATTENAEEKRNGPSASEAVSVAGSAHSLYNSYAYNPWSAYPSSGQFGGGAGAKGGVGAAAIDSKESIQEKEMAHLKSALSEKTKEVERLTLELEKSYAALEHLKNQNQALSNSLALITTQAHAAHSNATAPPPSNGSAESNTSG